MPDKNIYDEARRAMTVTKFISFSPALIPKVMDGGKTQTRRVMKQQPIHNMGMQNFVEKYSPYGQPGDILGVREAAWMWCARMEDGLTATGRDKYRYEPVANAIFRYVADHPQRPIYMPPRPDDGNIYVWRYKIPRYLPRWAVRTHVRVVGVGVERLQDISAKDILSEGAVARAHDSQFGHNPVSSFDGKIYLDLKSLWASGWDSLNKNRAPWESNPWVWTIAFERVQ